ncbi:putative repressor protein [Candidatus Regiella insecticola 5.15]|uniref:Putative repressor protein n=2 Tax=Candidatus Regiella insecticola TaxID=138073 RepID=G2GZX2_9ENTR|nr:putative repressor protein [Candidatus Regiella insecticola 5.15]
MMSKVIDYLVITNHNGLMEIKEIRRQRLKEWFKNRFLPGREKSYFSQLITGKAAFGERAARRIERSYGMQTGSLDVPIDPHPSMNTPVILSQQQKMLLELFDGLPKTEQKKFLQEIADKKNEVDQLFQEMIEKHGFNRKRSLHRAG